MAWINPICCHRRYAWAILLDDGELDRTADGVPFMFTTKRKATDFHSAGPGTVIHIEVTVHQVKEDE